MPGPWEKYAAQATPSAGPWAKYAQTDSAPVKEQPSFARKVFEATPAGVALHPELAPSGAGESAVHGLIGRTIGAMVGAHAEHLKKAAEQYQRGIKSRSDAANLVSEAMVGAIPGAPFINSVLQDVYAGRHEDAAAKVLGAAITGGAAKLAGNAPAVAESMGKLGEAVKAGAKAAGPDVAVGALKVGAGASLPKIPGVSYGLEYMGGKQVIKGLKAGVKAAKETYAPPAEVVAPEFVAPVVEEVVPPELDAFAVKTGFPDFASAPKEIQPLLKNAHAAEMDRAAQAANSPSPASTQAPVEPVSPTAPEAVAVPPRTVSPEAVGATVEPVDLEQQLEQSLEGKRVAPEERAALDAKSKAQSEIKSQQIKAREQSRRAMTLGQFLDQHAIPVDKMDLMTTEEWSQVGKLAGVENPSPTTVKMAIEYRKATQPAVSKTLPVAETTTVGEVMKKTRGKKK